MKRLFKGQLFTLYLLAAIGLAIVFPEPAASGGVLRSEWTVKVVIWLIFIFQGISLPTGEFVRGYRPKRLHAFVLSWNFILFPLVVWLLLLVFGRWIPQILHLGFLALAIMPTTIAMSVSSTAGAGGNVPNAIFATVFSNLLAILWVPTVAVAYLSLEGGVRVELWPVFRDLGFLIVLPLILGQVIRWLLPTLAQKIAPRARPLSNFFIVFIIHVAFANSVKSGIFSDSGSGLVFYALGSSALLLMLMTALVWWSSAWLRLVRSARIAAFFTGAQKSVATGLPILLSVLAALPADLNLAPALVLLPLLCYHPMQLFIAGVLIANGIGKAHGVAQNSEVSSQRSE
jgi:solute carrier family 10 (sodium/bile acid cotransporter), member 7